MYLLRGFHATRLTTIGTDVRPVECARARVESQTARCDEAVRDDAHRRRAVQVSRLDEARVGVVGPEQRTVDRWYTHVTSRANTVIYPPTHVHVRYINPPDCNPVCIVKRFDIGAANRC